ncbi:class I SAM-dependent methyltransferase [Acidocella aminolytica]|uniref:Methyltransferase type 11 n=1 Tax=Acidocella aminolytica 101 = DSM 11237 TaxID=1120923 RepID=A0A0D6PHE5_9PROT|nr:class I SAM-dependent methyltransferase [Acidocella aminolytica]GAN80796.1 methyltransferase type 11 [Acidocella aminolytica 101 = DSM 11237]GBQ36408.1 chemotaxis protein CheR [Acidocella aminolytica 101 = DSM 11237]SHE33224.1 Ubiquinone/menaquinone biosynthesis C-methylase UbiE [Acidocella aminolytica 101 = DSM 11237]
MLDDLWSRWLASGRDGGDANAKARVNAQTSTYATKLLDALPLAPGAALLDIGSGEGLVGFAALAHAPGLHVTFTDLSAPLLAKCEVRAQILGFAGQCGFVACSAARLAVPSASQDAITARSALAYEAHKPAAFAEMLRVLRPGGRFSIAEPLFREEALAAAAMRARLAVTPDPNLALLHRWKAAQYPDTPETIAAHPLTNYDERELLRMAQAAGFEALQMELHISLKPAPPRQWVAFLETSPHPLAPSLGALLKTHYSTAEAIMLERALRPFIEAGGTPQTQRMIYLSGAKPLSSSSSSS